MCVQYIYDRPDTCRYAEYMIFENTHIHHNIWKGSCPDSNTNFCLVHFYYNRMKNTTRALRDVRDGEDREGLLVERIELR